MGVRLRRLPRIYGQTSVQLGGRNNALRSRQEQSASPLQAAARKVRLVTIVPRVHRGDPNCGAGVPSDYRGGSGIPLVDQSLRRAVRPFRTSCTSPPPAPQSRKRKICSTCRTCLTSRREFPSRNAMFIHIKAANHARSPKTGKPGKYTRPRRPSLRQRRRIRRRLRS